MKKRVLAVVASWVFLIIMLNLLFFFNYFSGRFGFFTVAVALYFSIVIQFFLPAFHICRALLGKKAKDSQEWSRSAVRFPLFAMLSIGREDGGDLLVWLLISFVVLPYVAFAKYVTPGSLLHIPLGFLLALTICCQFKALFELLIFFIKKRRS